MTLLDVETLSFKITGFISLIRVSVDSFFCKGLCKKTIISFFALIPGPGRPKNAENAFEKNAHLGFETHNTPELLGQLLLPVFNWQFFSWIGPLIGKFVDFLPSARILILGNSRKLLVFLTGRDIQSHISLTLAASVLPWSQSLVFFFGRIFQKSVIFCPHPYPERQIMLFSITLPAFSNWLSSRTSSWLFKIKVSIDSFVLENYSVEEYTIFFPEIFKVQKVFSILTSRCSILSSSLTLRLSSSHMVSISSFIFVEN